MENIIFIGPMGAGKTSVSTQVAKKLGLDYITLDTYRWEVYEEAGYKKEEEERIRKEHGFSGVYKYWKQYEILLVEKVLAENSNKVIDFGGGHSVYENEGYYEILEKALLGSEVVLLLPKSIYGRVSDYDLDNNSFDLEAMEKVGESNTKDILAELDLRNEGRNKKVEKTEEEKKDFKEQFVDQYEEKINTKDDIIVIWNRVYNFKLISS